MTPSQNARPRRLRSTAARRELVAEQSLRASQLMLPVFVKEGLTSSQPIASMPGVSQHSLSELPRTLDRAIAAGITSVMIFAVPEERDETGSQAIEASGILNTAVAVAKSHVGERVVIVADLCLDEFTSHGHCGVLDSRGTVDNDRTLVLYQKMALSLAEAGVDFVGTSGMMDGQVAAIRDALDGAGHHDVGILAYAAKYASGYYGPFRDAVESSLEGDRKTYQQDPRNRIESTREIMLDLEQGADIIMVKPALSYLDIIADAARMSTVPVAAYLVSGEYSMIELAAREGLVERERIIWETLHSVHRAGAQIICTYWALEWAEKISQGEPHHV
jgi:porphobilinogen synthase